MKQLDMISMDFDYWFDAMVDMAKDNPDGFEYLRQQMIDEIIDDAPEKNRRRLMVCNGGLIRSGGWPEPRWRPVSECLI